MAHVPTFTCNAVVSRVSADVYPLSRAAINHRRTRTLPKSNNNIILPECRAIFPGRARVFFFKFFYSREHYAQYCAKVFLVVSSLSLLPGAILLFNYLLLKREDAETVTEIREANGHGEVYDALSLWSFIQYEFYFYGVAFF